MSAGVWAFPPEEDEADDDDGDGDEVQEDRRAAPQIKPQRVVLARCD